MTGTNRKVFSRAFRSHWDRENRWRIDGDMAKWSLWHYPLSWFELHWEVILIVVYSEDIPAAFRLHFVNYPQVPICRLLECILSIWQGIRSSHAFVVSPEFFLPPILPGPVSRLVVGEWLSGHRWWIWSTELTCLHERLDAVLSSEVWGWPKWTPGHSSVKL